MRSRHTKLGTEGTFAWVLRQFEKDPAFTENAEGTKDNWRYMIKWLEAALGKYSTTDTVNGIRPKLVQLALNQLADRPGQQANVRALLVKIDKWAAPLEYLQRPITFGVQTASKSDGGHVPWTLPQIALGFKEAGAHLPRVIKLGQHLGQRGSDIIGMRLNDIAYEENPLTGRRVQGIRLAQKKTGLSLWVPFTEEIADLIETWRPDILNGPAPWLLARKPDGNPYSDRDQLTKHWDRERSKPALSGLADLGYRTKRDRQVVLHGLRGSCVVALRKAGATVPMISSMIGMSAGMVTHYSRFADQVDMALAAVHKLEVGTAREQNTPGKVEKLA